MDSSVYSFWEVVILAVTLLATVAIAAAVWWQTRKHFQLAHSRGFIERFNSDHMVRVRQRVDDWLVTGEKPESLTDRIAAGDREAKEISDALRTFTNFFQEVGVAYGHKAVHRGYTWDVFGALAGRYWSQLAPYVQATRRRLDRPTLHDDFERFATSMRGFDERRGIATTATPPAGGPVAWIFGYGSLMDPESVERTVTDLDRARMRVAWLDGYRRGWTVWDEVEFSEDPPVRQPLAYLGLTEDPGARCNGILFPVSREQLATLDERERCYERIEVTAAIDADLSGPVYTYVGRPEYARFPPDVAVSERYLGTLNRALDRWGEDFRRAYEASTMDPVFELPTLTGDYEFTPERPRPVPDS